METHADIDPATTPAPETEDEPGTDALLKKIYRRIAYLTKAYREVMILYYIDGLPTKKIAEIQNTSEGAVRQRLFSARKKIKKEVEIMKDTIPRPTALDNMTFKIWGKGNPNWSDPRKVLKRRLSNHVLWLCHKKSSLPSEIAEELNVPTVYIEE